MATERDQFAVERRRDRQCREFGNEVVMSEPLRLHSRSGARSVETIARKLSHFTSNDHSPVWGSGLNARAWADGVAPQTPPSSDL
jgi:hypothetical protein